MESLSGLTEGYLSVPIRANSGRPGGLSVVIVTYNSSPVLPGLLDSLAAGLEGIADHDVIVVDNASQDGSDELAQAHPVGAKVIRMGRNAGYSAGINAATSTIEPTRDVLVLNPDIRLHPGSVALLLRRLSDRSVGIVVPQILNEDGTIAKSIRREPSIATVWSDALLGGNRAARMGVGEMVDDPAFYKTGGNIEWATGAILLISSEARRRIGEWDESFFLYSEEVDYLRRARMAGLAVLYAPEARAVHIGGECATNAFLTALSTTNRIRYYRRLHGPVASAFFRLGVIVNETIRVPLGPQHRTALRAALVGQSNLA
ncbi:glycosyltransferase family 2 protein [Sinorhizobium sp. BG8]|uniref:glycosyltransferase family 2 protein n=1 Tax=Sinorhizobium sp. BG8 TaxID=2613773 RepID=UPI00193E378B|nr:glycosyltransferase family 2 protein [Sinorhizobium sp. BG8]QRM57747.1 glycosyltransferase family 2 protein [Sinorhizobium sp. BG8]